MQHIHASLSLNLTITIAVYLSESTMSRRPLFQSAGLMAVELAAAPLQSRTGLDEWSSDGSEASGRRQLPSTDSCRNSAALIKLGLFWRQQSTEWCALFIFVNILQTH